MLYINIILQNLECLALCPDLFIFPAICNYYLFLFNISKLTFSTCTYSCRQKKRNIYWCFRPGWICNYSRCILHSLWVVEYFLLRGSFLYCWVNTCLLCPFTHTPLPLAVRTADGMWNLCSVMDQFQRCIKSHTVMKRWLYFKKLKQLSGQSIVFLSWTSHCY